MPTLLPNGAIIGQEKGHKWPTRSRRSGIKQANHVQQVAFEAVMALGKDLTEEADRQTRVKIAAALCNATKAWDCALNRKRVLKGQGNPAPVKADKPKRPKAHLDTPVEG